MKVKHLAAALATSVGFVGTAFAGATASIYNPDNTAGGTFTNIDWSSNGTAFTTGFAPTNAPGSSFTLTYFADSNAIYGGSVVTPHLDGDPTKPVIGSTYEYTVMAVLNETLNGCSGTASATTCSFTTNGGSFKVYYDNNPATFADNSTGKGFDDGLLQLAGVIGGGITSTFTVGTTGGLNVTSLGATITYTDTNPLDPAHINPALTSANTITTLQFGGFETATPASGFDGTPFTSANQVFQADGNSAFTVPEPGSLALLGLGAVAIGLGRRRRKAA